MEKSEPVPQGVGHAAAVIDITQQEVLEIREQVKEKKSWKDRRNAAKAAKAERATLPPAVKGGVIKNFFVSFWA